MKEVVECQVTSQLRQFRMLSVQYRLQLQSIQYILMKKYGGNKEVTESKSTKTVRAKIRYALRWLATLGSEPACQISILSVGHRT